MNKNAPVALVYCYRFVDPVDSDIRIYTCFNHLGPHDAIKHHFRSLKTDSIFQQPRVQNEYSHETGLPIHGNFLYFFNHINSGLEGLTMK